ncbi:MAG: hypothetical protein ACK5ZJ_17440 [Acidobacteriota bacterium]|jgi:hypothetical protein
MNVDQAQQLLLQTPQSLLSSLRPADLLQMPEEGDKVELPGKRKRDVLFYSGAKVERVDMWSGDMYDLSFAMDGGDVTQLAGKPVLNGHQQEEVEYVLGVVENPRRTRRGYEATLRFSDREDVAPVWQDIEDGILTSVSMGVQIVEMTQAPDSTVKRPHLLASKWRPFEISIVPIGADPGAKFLSASLSAAKRISTAPSAAENHARHELALRERRWRVFGR